MMMDEGCLHGPRVLWHQMVIDDKELKVYLFGQGLHVTAILSLKGVRS